MKKKSKKELESMVELLEKNIASYNILFSLYVKFKGDGILFQEFLAKELKKE
jgi:hypothetical protein